MAIALLMAMRSAGRDRLPAWVVRIRSVLCFMAPAPQNDPARMLVESRQRRQRRPAAEDKCFRAKGSSSLRRDYRQDQARCMRAVAMKTVSGHQRRVVRK